MLFVTPFLFLLYSPRLLQPPVRNQRQFDELFNRELLGPFVENRQGVVRTILSQQWFHRVPECLTTLVERGLDYRFE